MNYLAEPFLINGEWRAGCGARVGPVYNPATGERIGDLAYVERAEMDAALAAADKGFAAWRRVSAFERYKILRAAADLVRQRMEEIAACIGFLASNEASYVTGSVLTVDGGMSA